MSRSPNGVGSCKLLLMGDVRRQHSYRMMCCSVLAASAVCVGCSGHDGDNEFAERFRSAGEPLGYQIEREGDGLNKMGPTLQTFFVRERQSVPDAAENGREIGRWLEHDVERFADKQPYYRAGIYDQVNGDLAGAADTFHRLLP